MTQKKYQQLIGSEHDGQRVDNFIMSQLSGVPRSRIYRAVRSGEVRVNGGRIKAEHRLKAGDQVRVPPLVASEKPTILVPHWMKKAVQESIFHEACDIKVLNKPSGFSVHTGTGVASGVIEAITQIEDDQHWKLVHRLDRQTSGCLLLARQGKVLRSLSQQFRERSVEKRYLAVVSGSWKHGAMRVDLPLEKHATEGGERMVVVNHSATSAVSHVTPLWVGDNMSLLEVRLETGRTHQIRVHLSYLGHPVVGDQKYADKALSRKWHKLYKDSLFLHSAVLGFEYGGDRMEARAAIPDFWSDLPIWRKIKEIGPLRVESRVIPIS